MFYLDRIHSTCMCVFSLIHSSFDTSWRLVIYVFILRLIPAKEKLCWFTIIWRGGSLCVCGCVLVSWRFQMKPRWGTNWTNWTYTAIQGVACVKELCRKARSVQNDGALPRGRAYKSLLRSCILNTTITFILTACKSLTTSTATPVYSHMLIKGINCNSLLLMEVRAVKS